MRENVSDNVEIKAAGGVRGLDQALEVLGTGTVRIGTSGSKKILEDAKDRAKDGGLVIPEQKG